ncbi:MAG: 5-methylthioadenosine phosphorylase [Thermoleophilaceae bacterium]|jgi:purine nucleoside phosphorylase|nr:5-methylthioadenosine phosphorylase [Thermoleophilaceae bacterium]MEA2457258.1 5-methylthioadenosine phosphorylase [Thermoleophilaceae bacterium]
MKVGVLTGTGTYALDDGGAAPEPVPTPYGEALVSRGESNGVEVLHISRHEEGHRRLSNHVSHRANIAAMKQLGAECVVAVTVCGAVDHSVPLGSLIAFDDLHFLSNRLADGTLCTYHDTAGQRRRGHWIFESPFSDGLRRVLLEACIEAGVPARDGGCYGHVDGPRFNTRAEIRSLALAGVTAVSQTAGPETVLCGEAEMPYALLGYATDYANGVSEEATPVEELLRLIGASKDVFRSVLGHTLPKLARAEISPPGVMYSFGE